MYQNDLHSYMYSINIVENRYTKACTVHAEVFFHIATTAVTIIKSTVFIVIDIITKAITQPFSSSSFVFKGTKKYFKIQSFELILKNTYFHTSD